MNEFFNNATTVTVGEGFTAFECVTAKFNTDYSASYRDGNTQRTKKWVKGDTIQGYLIQDKLNKYVRTGVNNICPKSGDTIINVPANNSTIITILPKQKPPITSGNGCLEMTFKKDYQVTFFSDEKSLKGNWLKGDLIRGTVHRNGEFVTIKTSTKGTCSLDTADSYLVGIFGDEAEMKDLLEIKDTTQTSTMQHIPSVPLRNIKGLSGDANTTENPLVDLVAGSGFGKFMSGQKRMMTFASVGSLYGFYRAYQGNKKIGGYIGNALLFSLIGYAVGYLSLKIVPPKSNFVVTQGGTNSFSNAVSNQELSATKCNCKSKMYVVENIGGTMYYVKYYLSKGRYFYQTNPDGTINYATRMCNPEKICGEPILIKLDPPIPAPTGGIIATNP